MTKNKTAYRYPNRYKALKNAYSDVEIVTYVEECDYTDFYSIRNGDSCCFRVRDIENANQITER